MPRPNGLPRLVSRLRVPFPDLPADLERLKICHLSDLHVVRPTPLLERVKELVEQEKPELICITGDLVWRGVSVPQALVDFLSDIDAQLGVFAVPGNWEYKGDIPKGELAVALETAGVDFLSNENRSVTYRSARFSIIGFDDPTYEQHDVDKALQGVRAEEFCIALAHNHDIAEELVGRGIDLLLAGHTHGGQILLPGIPPFWLRFFGKKSTAGLLHYDSMVAYVSRGLGAVGIAPFRLNCPPEVTFIELAREGRSGGQRPDTG